MSLNVSALRSRLSGARRGVASLLPSPQRPLRPPLDLPWPVALLALTLLLVAGGALVAGGGLRLAPAAADLHAARAGDPLRVSVRVEAGSDLRATWAVFLSADGDLDARDRRLGDWREVDLSAGASRELSARVQLPAGLPTQSYALGVILRAGSQQWISLDPLPLSVGEGPNLWAELSAPLHARVGGELELQLRVVNGGDQGAPATRLGLYLSRNEAITRQDLRLEERDLDPLPAGAERTLTLRVPLSSSIGPEPYFVGALLDLDRDADETDEEDNAARAPGRTYVHDGQGPNPRAIALELDSTRLPAGGTLEVRRVIRNEGDVPTGPLTYTLVLSNNATISAYDPVVLRGTLASLAPGEQSEARVQVRVPPGTAARSYWFGMRIDPDDAISESEEGDNRIAAGERLEVVEAPTGDLPQLRVEGVAPSHWTVRPGEDLPLERVVVNEGAGDAPAFDYVVVLSADRRISLADRELYRYRFVSGLGAQRRHSRSVQVPIPQDVEVGEWHLGVIVDPGAEVSEADEDDQQAVSSHFVRVERGRSVRRFDPEDAYASDGDTIRVEGQSYRLIGYDTPEKSGPSFSGNQQPYANVARDATRAYLRQANELALHVASTDQYGRTLAHAFVDGRSLAKLMIEAEHAYETIGVFGDEGFRELGRELRDAQRGHQPAFEKPWLFRWRNKR